MTHPVRTADAWWRLRGSCGEPDCLAADGPLYVTAAQRDLILSGATEDAAAAMT